MAVQDFKFRAVGRIKETKTELITRDGPMRGKAMTTLLIESDGTNFRDEHPLLEVKAYGEKSVTAGKFEVGTEVEIDGRMRGGAPRVDTHGVEHYRTSLSVGNIKVAEGLEHGFTFEATGNMKRVSLGQVERSGDAKASVVLERTYNERGDIAMLEVAAYRDTALDAGEAGQGDNLVIKGEIVSRPQIDYETNQTKTDLNGRPYYNTMVTASEVVNLTPHVDKEAPTKDEQEAEAEIPF